MIGLKTQTLEGAELPYYLPSELSRAQQASQERILAAAKRRFARYGYEGTTLAEVAHEAGVPPRTCCRCSKTS